MKTMLFGALTAAALLLSCSNDDENSQIRPQELPVKVTQWNASGALDIRQEIFYDNQQRIAEINITEANSANNRTILYHYESGKVTLNTDYLDPAKTDEMYIYYQNNGKITKEMWYWGGALFQVYTWTDNLVDGTKKAICKTGAGDLYRTYNYHFNSKGNCTSIRVNEADPTATDFTITFDAYDTHPRALFHHGWLSPWAVVPGVIRNPGLPNNPGTYQRTPDGQTPSYSHAFTYEYNTSGKVAFQRNYDEKNGSRLMSSTVYEYSMIE